MSDALLRAMVDRDADPVDVAPSFAGQTCSVSTHLPNRILLLNCPGQLTTFLHAAIRTSYRPGIARQEGRETLVLHGTPFQAPGPGETSGPQIHCAIVRCMLSCGWRIACSACVSLRVSDVHTFFFEKDDSATRTADVVCCALAFVESNRIRVVDGPVALVALLRRTLEAHWRRGERGAVVFRVRESVPEFTLRGRVFDAAGPGEVVAARTLLAQMLSKMSAAGYAVVAACQTRVSNAGMRPQELDTWIVRCPGDNPGGGEGEGEAEVEVERSEERRAELKLKFRD